MLTLQSVIEADASFMRPFEADIQINAREWWNWQTR
jgi:hypothetical protein